MLILRCFSFNFFLAVAYKNEQHGADVVWFAETESDDEDVAVSDDRPVVPHQSLAHAVVVPARGLS